MPARFVAHSHGVYTAHTMRQLSSRWTFGLFFLSGCSALICQIVWLRLAFAAFGIVTPVMSVLLSGFMLGLGLGSWAAGAIVRRLEWGWRTALWGYAAAELIIGMGALGVPWLFSRGAQLLLPAGETGSANYLLHSAVVMLLALLPFCFAMGLTFPFMMQAVRANALISSGGGARNSFSQLYLANVLGALFGTSAVSLVLVELWGFHGALIVAALCNWSAAAMSLWLSLCREDSPSSEAPVEAAAPRSTASQPRPNGSFALLVLCTTGLASMAVEVVWTRVFTPVLTTHVYAFAALLFAYLLATWLGSWLYRRHLTEGCVLPVPLLLAGLALAAFAQLLAADPRLVFSQYGLRVFWVLLGISPYCAILGYLTPCLIDRYSQGDPALAGRAYAVNIAGCILGPLLASYVLLPWLGVHWSGVALAGPFWCLSLLALKIAPASAGAAPLAGLWPRGVWGAATACGVLAALFGTSYEDRYAAAGAMVLRDHTATVIAVEEGSRKDLYVNGKMITATTPTTKLMAHLPLCLLPHKPQSVLVICFGMGSTYRSSLAWGVDTTAVELVPSVRDAFGFFFDNAASLLASDDGRVVIDDGRRFLRRTNERYDVITIDPPPPVEAAGSSLLYSTEFYELLKPRLAPGGILQQWYPGGDLKILQAVLRSVDDTFKYVRVMRAFDGWGYHILASEEPLRSASAAELATALPESARQDLLEWTPKRTAESLLGAILDAELDYVLALDSDRTVAITDDRPYNEYFLLRRIWQWWIGSYTIAL